MTHCTTSSLSLCLLLPSGIRELIPRLYIDMCLLKCYRFVDSDDAYPARFARLSRMIRGIGDPLCATYARAYLATKCGDVWQCFSSEGAKAGTATQIPKVYQSCLVEGFDDFLFTFKSLLSGDCQSIRTIKEGKISKEDYLDLYSPALQWLLQNIGQLQHRKKHHTLCSRSAATP